MNRLKTLIDKILLQLYCQIILKLINYFFIIYYYSIIIIITDDTLNTLYFS